MAQPPADTIGADTTVRKKRWNDAFAKLHVGGVLPELSRNPPGQPAPFNENLFWSFRAGLTVEAIHTRWYGLRAELGYIRRGGVEVFASPNGFQVESRTALHYGQVTVLPAILKAGSPAFRWFAGAGGYGAYLLGATQTHRYTGGYTTDESPLFTKALATIDYGAVLSTGIYWKKTIIELRYESGLAPVFTYPDGRPVAHRSASFMLHF